MKRIFVGAWISLAFLLRSAAGQQVSDLDYFETRIRPVLEAECYQCHSARAEKVKGGLYLDSKTGWMTGGESGHAAIIAGKPSESPLVAAIEWKDEDSRMPPKKKLPDATVADLKQWIAVGAPDPRIKTTASAAPDVALREAREFWAFKPPTKTRPSADADDWARNDIDRFLLAAMKEKGLHPAPDADARTLIRRATFDLTGLPPRPEDATEPYADVVDRLLDSPRFGEKWGRHWLDVARYAESSGGNVNFLYAQAWRYRDYVIASFNADKPYDQFIKEQIAGDLLPFRDERDQAGKIIATGFLAIGAKSHDETDRGKFLVDVADEQINVVTEAMLGLSVACARCHDHKHDPISQRDYYALAGIFLSSETLFGTCYQLQNWNNSSLIELSPSVAMPSARRSLTPQALADLDQKVIITKRAEIEASFKRQTDRYHARFTREEASFAKAERDLYDADGRPKTLVMGVLDRDTPTDTRLLIRGEVSQPSDTVPRGIVRVLCGEESQPIQKGSGRLQLAQFIASRENPLTARVLVNRVWSKLFGRGIVSTPDNFGHMGARPSHPELLDYLAVWFVENGWSVKKLIREIMLSRAYQQSTRFDARNDEIDPDNQYIWRMSRRRLDAESIRDAMLAVSGSLEVRPPMGSPVALLRESRTGPDDLAKVMVGKPQVHRSIYLPIVRGQPPAALACFDFADPSSVCGQRNVTNVPAQSLFLMNDVFVQSEADAFAARISQRGGSVQEQAEEAFERSFYRLPTDDERAAIGSFLKSFASLVPANDRLALLSVYCQSLFASGEFCYLN